MLCRETGRLIECSKAHSLPQLLRYMWSLLWNLSTSSSILENSFSGRCVKLEGSSILLLHLMRNTITRSSRFSGEDLTFSIGAFAKMKEATTAAANHDLLLHRFPQLWLLQRRFKTHSPLMNALQVQLRL